MDGKPRYRKLDFPVDVVGYGELGVRPGVTEIDPVAKYRSTKASEAVSPRSECETQLPPNEAPPQQVGQESKTKTCLQNHITLISFLGQDAEIRSTPNGNGYTGFSLVIFDVSGRNREGTQLTESLEWSPNRFQLRHHIHSDRSRNIRRLRRGAKSK